MRVVKRPSTYKADRFLSDLEPNKNKRSTASNEKFHGFNVFVDEKGPVFVVRQLDGDFVRAYSGDYLLKDQDDNYLVVTEDQFKREYLRV